tara:strand:+ start:2302 stop:2541 length:240 start_codon:yes stop_codon:yes gene_type:complete
MKDSIKFIFNISVILLSIFCLYKILTFSVPKDSTDSEDKRSGMILYNDYQTGCQYLGGLFGGITPRLDAEGKHICLTKK